jgi:hypothetical protein
MAAAPKTIRHPTFGPCELNPAVVAIRWRRPLTPEAVKAALSALDLSVPEPDARPRAATKGKTASTARPDDAGRDPQAATVNQSATLTWASGAKLTDAVIKRAEGDANVEWVGPVYRATAATGGERSYFAINPTVLILNDAAAAKVKVTDVDDSAVVDTNRTGVLRGFVVYRLPNNNAIEVGQRLAGSTWPTGRPSRGRPARPGTWSTTGGSTCRVRT